MPRSRISAKGPGDIAHHDRAVTCSYWIGSQMDTVIGQGRIGGQQRGLYHGGRTDEIHEEGVPIGPAPHNHQHGFEIKAPLGLLQRRKIQSKVVLGILQIYNILLHQTEHPQQQMLFSTLLTLDRLE